MKHRKIIWLGAATLAAVCVIILIGGIRPYDHSVEKGPPQKSLAVLPLVAIGRGNDEYFADGLAEEILNALARLPELQVSARMSSFHFKGQDISTSEIARMLGVDHVVEGTVRRDDSRVRVTVQLVRAADNDRIWSAGYDFDVGDTFDIRTDIVEKIAVALDLPMDDEQRSRIVKEGVRNPDAFVAFQKGVELFDLAHGSGTVVDSLLEANALFDQAIQVEPRYSEPYLYSADYFTHLLIGAIHDPNVTDEARDTAMQNLVELHNKAVYYAANEANRAVAAYDLAVLSGQWQTLPVLYDRITSVSGCFSTGWLLEVSVPYGLATTVLPRALSETKCNPMNFSGWIAASSAYVYLGDFDAAIETAQRGLEYSTHRRVYQQLVFATIAAGRFDEADAIIDRHLHRKDLSLPLQVMLSAARGDAELAATQLRRLLEMNTSSTQPPIAQLAVTGNRRVANEMAAKIDAIENGHLILALYPRLCRCGAPFDLEATPNFAKLIRDANFPWPPASPIEWPLKDR